MSSIDPADLIAELDRVRKNAALPSGRAADQVANRLKPGQA